MSPSDGEALPADEAGWTRVFSGFSDIVLVANSESVDAEALRTRFPEETLFVFFNKVYKVLDKPFGGRSLLVARSSEAGANIVYRREVAEVTRLLEGPNFLGLLNLKAGPQEAFSPTADFGGRRVGFLDLVAPFRDLYPRTHVPSSGFALAFWLCEQRLPVRVHLAGFSGQRGTRLKLFRVHDWTFEQIVQRLLQRTGRLHVACAEAGGEGALERIAARMPDVPPATIAATAAEVLAERLEGSDMAIDRLFQITRLTERLDRMLRSLKPKTRKQRLAEERTREKGQGIG